MASDICPICVNDACFWRHDCVRVLKPEERDSCISQALLIRSTKLFILSSIFSSSFLSWLFLCLRDWALYQFWISGSKNVEDCELWTQDMNDWLLMTSSVRSECVSVGKRGLKESFSTTLVNKFTAHSLLATSRTTLNNAVTSAVSLTTGNLGVGW